jgi:hypothetical protein
MNRLLIAALCLSSAGLALPEAAGQRTAYTIQGVYAGLCSWGNDAYGLSETQWKSARGDLKRTLDGARIRFDSLPVEGATMNVRGGGLGTMQAVARVGFRILREGNDTAMVFNERDQIVGPLPGRLAPKVEAFWRSFDKFDRVDSECPPWWIWFQFPPDELQLKVSDTLRIDGFGRIITFSFEELDLPPFGHIVTTIELLSWRPSGL